MATAADNLYSNRLMPLLANQRLAKSGRFARLVANGRLMTVAFWAATGVLTLIVGLAALGNGLSPAQQLGPDLVGHRHQRRLQLHLKHHGQDQVA